ncbi:hypothetical protein [Variovorax sp. WDL1]|uniref:hypothetical protein n=1 Tax=Variovorax sp. WDL1 TaxID=207745 RepID=UPI003FCD6D7E
MLAALILKPKEERDTFLVRRAKKIYLPLLDWALERKALVVGSAVVLLLASLALFPFLARSSCRSYRRGPFSSV